MWTIECYECGRAFEAEGEEINCRFSGCTYNEDRARVLKDLEQMRKLRDEQGGMERM
jgi:hypothetical protein